MSKFMSIICIGLFCVCLNSSRAEDAKLVSLPEVKRAPVLASPMVFPRIRTHYNIFRNVYQNFHEKPWVDRPLFHDFSLNDVDPSEKIFKNYMTHLNLAMDYGADGLSMLYHSPIFFSRFNYLIDTADICYQNNKNKVLISLIGHVLREGPEHAADVFEPVLKRLLVSQSAARVNGKVLIASYRSDYVSPEELARFIEIMKQRCGDTFYFVPAIGNLAGKKISNWVKWEIAFNNNDGKLPEDEIEAAKAYLRSYLKVSDGILMNGSNHLDTQDNFFDKRFYNEFVVRLFAEVLNEPENKGKLLGLSASLGYVNHIAAGTQREDGTRALRETFEIALNAGADFIIMPEWNELNENTCLEPTVNRSFSTKRIMRYYMQKFKNKGRMSPVPGDNLDIPNLIVSMRAFLKLGDKLFIELLNVPDSKNGKKYWVECALKDENGNIVKAFPKQEFNSSELMERRLCVPSESLKSRIVHPVLTVTDEKGNSKIYSDGLPFTKIRATWNENLTCLKQPLRDLADIKNFNVKFTPSLKDGLANFKIDLDMKKDKVRHLEILENDIVVYSYDESKKYALKDDEILLHMYYFSFNEVKPFWIEMGVENGAIRLFNDRLKVGGSREAKWMVEPKVEMKWKSNRNRRGGIFIVSNKDKAVLRIKSSIFDERIKVSDIEKYGSFAQNFNKTIFLCVEKDNKALEIPSPANCEKVDVDVSLNPLDKDAVYRVRLVTMSGKTFNKGPYVFPVEKSNKTAKLKFFSEALGKVAELDVDKAFCSKLEYKFDPASNALLKTSQGERWTATLGGGYSYGGAFSKNNNYLKDGSNTAPVWIKEGEANLLKFDGKGNYLHFPSEVLPAKGNFTIEFEFKPFSLKDQYLIKSNNMFPGTLDINIKNKHLECVYRGELLKGEKPYFKEIIIKSPVKLEENKWTKVKLSYNFENFCLSVNDSDPVQVPCSRRGWWMFSPFAFGGWGDKSDMYFDGLLKSFEVKHYAD